MPSRSRTRQLVTGASVALFLSLASAGMAHADESTADPAAGIDTTAAAGAPCTLPTPFRSQNFSAGLRIDNRFLPLRPGTALKYRGHVVEDGQQVTHEVIFVVTN